MTSKQVKSIEYMIQKKKLKNLKYNTMKFHIKTQYQNKK